MDFSLDDAIGWLVEKIIPPLLIAFVAFCLLTLSVVVVDEVVFNGSEVRSQARHQEYIELPRLSFRRTFGIASRPNPSTPSVTPPAPTMPDRPTYAVPSPPAAHARAAKTTKI
jgi:hypothetical protein